MSKISVPQNKQEEERIKYYSDKSLKDHEFEPWDSERLARLVSELPEAGFVSVYSSPDRKTVYIMGVIENEHYRISRLNGTINVERGVQMNNPGTERELERRYGSYNVEDTTHSRVKELLFSS